MSSFIVYSSLPSEIIVLLTLVLSLITVVSLYQIVVTLETDLTLHSIVTLPSFGMIRGFVTKTGDRSSSSPPAIYAIY